MASFDELKNKTIQSLKSKFDEKAAECFEEVLEHCEFESLEEVVEDLQSSGGAKDASEIESSIVEEMATKFEWDDEQQLQCLKLLRITYGLDEPQESEEAKQDDEKQEKLVLPTDVVWTNFDKSQFQETRDYMNGQTHNAFADRPDTSFLEITTMGRNNNINLVPLLFDVYSYYRYSDMTSRKTLNIPHAQFCAKTAFFTAMKNKDDRHREVYNAVVQTLSSYQYRITPPFQPNNPNKIDDDINAYIRITLMVSKMLNETLVAKKRDISPFPVLVDVWIIPSKVREKLQVAVDEDDEDDEEEEEEEEEEDDANTAVKEDKLTKDFTVNLQKFNLEFEAATINLDDEAKTFKTLCSKFEKVFNKTRRSIKLNIIIDRRRESDNLIVYQLPLKYAAIPQNYCGETLIYSTAEYMMYDMDNSVLQQSKRDPAKEVSPIFGAKVDCDGRMFCVSFAMLGANKSRMQFWRHGGGIRFWPSYMLTLWPKLFVNAKINKQFTENNYVEDNFKIAWKDALFDAWYKAIVDF